MKKFFLNAIVLVMLLVVADYEVGRLFVGLDKFLYTYPIDYHNSYEKTMGGGNHEDMIIIGHSRARHHYIPVQMEDSLGITVINAAKDGTGFLTQAALINGMVKKNAPKYILWEVRPNVFQKAEQIEIDRLTDLFPFYDTDSLSRKIVQMRGPYEKFKMLSYSYRNNGRLWGRLEMLMKGNHDNGLKGFAPSKASMKHPEMKLYEYKNPYDPLREALFVEVVNNVHKAGTKLILSMSPVYETSIIYELDETKRFYAVADSLDVPILDFFYHPEFLEHPEWFKDHTHMNMDGVQHYMDVFIPKLKNAINNVQ